MGCGFIIYRLCNIQCSKFGIEVVSCYNMEHCHCWTCIYNWCPVSDQLEKKKIGYITEQSVSSMKKYLYAVIVSVAYYVYNSLEENSE